MFGFLRSIHLLKEVDGLAFGKRARIRLKLVGRPDYKIVRSRDRQSIKREYYLMPIFLRSHRTYDPVRMAIHEVRHRVQYNYPDIRLFTIEDEDLPHDFRAFLHVHLQAETARKLSPREVDAQIFDELAYPVFLSGDNDGFLRLLFHGTNLQDPI